MDRRTITSEISTVFEFDYSVQAEDMRSLYEKAKRDQWNASRDIPWDTPETMRTLTARQIERAIYPVVFYRTKARVILRICADLIERFGGKVPDDIDALLTLDGVGRKTANLVVTMGFDKPGICVDTHVHRISNRLGYVRTRTPEETEMALRAKLPRRYWIGYNDLLVTFGQNLCVPISPKCSGCPVRALCPRVGVTTSR